MNRQITMKTKLALFPWELKIGKNNKSYCFNVCMNPINYKKYRNSIFPWKSKVESYYLVFFSKLYVNAGNRIQ